jgi:hypothetical protein
MDASPWWLTMPPCPHCGLSHVLIDCTQRLPFEVQPEVGRA